MPTARVPDAVQRERIARVVPLIRDRHGLEWSRVCSAALRFATCCAAPGTRAGDIIAQRPVRASECTQPTMRERAFSISFLLKKSSGLTRSTG